MYIDEGESGLGIAAGSDPAVDCHFRTDAYLAGQGFLYTVKQHNNRGLYTVSG
jgi:hypothetical protein